MRAGQPVSYLVTCEHGGREVPPAYRSLFDGAEEPLASHRGWDAGAAPLARYLADALDAPLHLATVTRLLVDLNRSPSHPKVFSEWTRPLPSYERGELLATYHAPHRDAVAASVAGLAESGREVVHLAVHTFTPVLDGRARAADLALLYDPARAPERALAGAWVAKLSRRLPDLAVRRNQPYRGVSDGLTTWLRSRFSAAAYLGIEIEVNQRLLATGGDRLPDRIGAGLVEALLEVVSLDPG